MKSVLLLPLSLASLAVAQAQLSRPSIYVLLPSEEPTSAVTEALDILGYSHSTGGAIADYPTLDTDTYTILSQGAEYQNISRLHPEAKFILPTSSRPKAQSRFSYFFQTKPTTQQPVSREYQTSVRDFFEQTAGSPQLLELDVDAPRSDLQAQTWVTLCEFLGLGYSMVERMKLWQFP
ncbi:hypothetical protein F4780DRAFT_783662 [Xylariomycetidae sp. FL0641]|nr:hypothetical protein F4780DRAFT_783662 [Xylariomycetidae sp. FL0641]